MHMETTLKINKNRIINIFILVIVTILFVMLFILKKEIPCMFKSILGISCPGCGMTRAINEIIHLRFINAFKFNILSIPLVIIGSISFFVIIHDTIKNSDIFIQFINKAFAKFWYIFIILIVFSMVINNVIKLW